MVNANKLSADL